MFNLVVLTACIVAVTVADPGYIADSYGLGNSYGYNGLGYGYGHGGYAAIPSTVSHQSQFNIHSKPIITAVAAAPVIVKPALYLPSATSHQSRVDYVSKPIVYSKPIVSYASPALSYGSNYIASSPIFNGLYDKGHNGLQEHGLEYANNLEYGSGLGYRNGLGYGHSYYGSQY